LLLGFFLLASGGFLPLKGFFHLAMNFLKMFLKNHLGSPNDPASVAGCNAVLRRKHVDDKVSDFWSVLDLVNDSLDSFVLDMVIEKAGLASLDDLTAFLAHDCQRPHPRWPEVVERCPALLRPDSVATLRQADEDRRNEVRMVYFKARGLHIVKNPGIEKHLFHLHTMIPGWHTWLRQFAERHVAWNDRAKEPVIVFDDDPTRNILVGEVVSMGKGAGGPITSKIHRGQSGTVREFSITLFLKAIQTDGRLPLFCVPYQALSS
jgi:hypothetical protein